ncbi:AraC family transcriptional regulator [Microbacterium mangrovi]|uniref:AraC family transcriptional regulator n=1 Tax=Microbacterium mangrovi TaxID=1348253 RepID=A0A0B2A3C4_9MICO|nr:helix-turn-helix domain-containing protein [Microbacterium mangrovi]KHK97999.1 AraC family transcriptional regulator [Microbacterium mangrovi]
MLPRVAVIAFDRISPFHLAVPSLVWGEELADELPGGWPVMIAAEHPGRLTTNAGYAIDVANGLDAAADADIVVVPWWDDPDEPASGAVVDALQTAHARGATVVGLCLGAFVLADAGLLDGRRATTHWQWADAFRRRFPAVRLQPEALYVDEGAIVTGAGSTAGVDTCLHLLARHAGQATANRVARRIVAAPHRAGGQAQFIEAPLPDAPRDALSDVLSWAAEHLDERVTIDELASRAHLSRSTFTRAFRARTGTTVHEWLTAGRLARARHLLETTTLGVDAVAARAGFGSAARLREVFARELGTAPTRYRAEFGTAAVRPAWA